MAAAAMLKITKIAIYPQRFDRSLRNLVRWCKMGLLTAPAVKKNSNFTNPRWRTAAILRTVKSPYLCSRLSNFDEIWHNDAYWPHTAERRLKFLISDACWSPESGVNFKILIFDNCIRQIAAI